MGDSATLALPNKVNVAEKNLGVALFRLTGFHGLK